MGGGPSAVTGIGMSSEGGTTTRLQFFYIDNQLKQKQNNMQITPPVLWHDSV